MPQKENNLTAYVLASVREGRVYDASFVPTFTFCRAWRSIVESLRGGCIQSHEIERIISCLEEKKDYVTPCISFSCTDNKVLTVASWVHPIALPSYTNLDEWNVILNELQCLQNKMIEAQERGADIHHELLDVVGDSPDSRQRIMEALALSFSIDGKEVAGCWEWLVEFGYGQVNNNLNFEKTKQLLISLDIPEDENEYFSENGIGETLACDCRRREGKVGTCTAWIEMTLMNSERRTCLAAPFLAYLRRLLAEYERAILRVAI